MPNSISLPAPITMSEGAAAVLSWLAAQSGVITDYNIGSQIRTFSEALGSVSESQGVIAQALAYQAAIFSAFYIYKITPYGAISAVGTVTFSTGTGSSPPPATQAVFIPTGTIVGTTGGIQFVTTEDATLAAGATSINVTISAVIPGSSGNVAANTIVQLVSTISYPLYVTNAAQTSQGADAETPDETLTRFTAAVAAVGGSSPVAIANAVIGITASGSTERVMLATCYEPWVVTSGAGAGFSVYIDNGSGAASVNLISQVTSFLNGNQSTGQIGARPAGVPYSVDAVVTSGVTIAVSGTLIYPQLATQATTAAVAAEQQYFSSLQFGQAAELSQLTAQVGGALAGYLSSLTVALYYSGNSETVVSVAPYGRVILTSYTNSFS